MTLHEPPFHVAVLAGGQSRRMGRDKAALELGDSTLLERVVRICLPVAPTLVVGRPRPLGFSEPTVAFIPDDTPGLGPMGGLLTALNHAQTPICLVGCDMPLLKTRSLRWLAAELSRSHAPHGLAIHRNGRLEPLFSVYRPSTIALIQRSLSQGRRSLRHLLEHGQFDTAAAPAHLAKTLTNINTPDQYRAILPNDSPP